MSERVIDDPFVAKYARKIDGVIKTHIREDLEVELDVIVDNAKARLRALAVTAAPDYLFLYPDRPREDRMRSRTLAELVSRRSVVREFGEPQERFVIVPGEMGPVPQGFEVGNTYQLRGFAASGFAAGCVLSEVDLISPDGSFSFLSNRDLTYFDGEMLRYDGTFPGGCDLCQAPPTPYDAFTLLRPNGKVAFEEDYIPKQFSVLPGMVTIIGEAV